MNTLCAECVLTGQRTPAVTLVGGTALCEAHVHRRARRHPPGQIGAARPAPPAQPVPEDATLADLVRDSRRAQDLTQAELARLTGLSTCTLRRIERGHAVGLRGTTRVALERALVLPAGSVSAAARRSTEVAS